MQQPSSRTQKHPRASTEFDVTSILYGKSIGTMRLFSLREHFHLLSLLTASYLTLQFKTKAECAGGLEQRPGVSSNVRKWASYKGPLSAVILKWHWKVATSLSWGETKERKAKLLLVSCLDSPDTARHAVHLTSILSSPLLITIIPLQIWSKATAGRTVIY